MEKRKQRAIYMTDTDWEVVRKAAQKSGARNLTSYVEEVVIKASTKELKR